MQSIAKQASDIFFQCTQHHAKLSLAIKTQSIENIQQALINPYIIVSENKIQEAENRKDFLQQLPNQKHFIGHLQKNKIRKAVQIFSCIESVDTLELLYAIDRIAEEENKPIQVFLNINISEDENKTGFLLDHVPEIIESLKKTPLKTIKITGLFTILKNNCSPQETLIFYQSMKKIFLTLKKLFGDEFTELSMGMSNDYQIALMAGSTLVRIGSAVFGKQA